MSCTISFWTLSINSSLLTLVTQVWRVSLCSLPRWLATAHKLALNDLFCSLLDPVLSADWTEHGSATMFVVKDSGACLVVVHVCRTVDRVVGHRRPSLAGIGVPCMSLREPPMCLDAQGGIKAKRQPFAVVGVWSCQCLVVVQTRST